jgi:hypothetical protein
MNPGPEPDPGKSPIIGLFKGVDPTKILNSVKASTKQVRLSSYEPSTAEVTVTNTMPGKVTLDYKLSPMAGLTAKFDKTELAENESATLRFEYTPADKTPKPTLVTYIHVQQTGQNLPVTLTFAIPPEVEKLLPRR